MFKFHRSTLHWDVSDKSKNRRTLMALKQYQKMHLVTKMKEFFTLMCTNVIVVKGSNECQQTTCFETYFDSSQIPKSVINYLKTFWPCQESRAVKLVSAVTRWPPVFISFNWNRLQLFLLSFMDIPAWSLNIDSKKVQIRQRYQATCCYFHGRKIE